MMIQTNASTVVFVVLMASVNVKTMQLDFSVKSNQLRMATVILSITPLNTIMMVVTAAKVHVSVQTRIHVAKMHLVLLMLVIFTATMTKSRMMSGSRVAIQ